MSSRVLAALLALLALGAAIPAGAGAIPRDRAGTAPHQAAGASLQPAADGAAGPAQQATAEPAPVAERTRFVVQLHDDGDATWTVETTFRLTSESQRAAFRSLAEDFRNGRSVGLGIEAFRRYNDAAEEATDRPMAIRNVERTASPPEGRLSLSFRWTNFARLNGNRTTVGDAFNTTSGTWFSGLDDGQTLIVRLPSGNGFLSTPDGTRYVVRAGTIRWEGPQEFEAGDLRFQYQGGLSIPERVLMAAERNPDLVFGGALVIAVVVGTIVLSRREDRDSVPDLVGRLPVVGGDSGPSANGSGTTGSATPADGGQASTTPGDAEGTTGGDDDPSAASAAAATEDGSAVDPELLSDEERVERLLAENGGRMKQANIVSETGWSNAKVSQLLSSMAEDGRVDKLRIGRENLISFPDEEITDIEE